MGITAETYYENDEYMSISQFKRLEKCELGGVEEWDDSDTSVAMLVGQYVDSWVEGTLDAFKESHPEIISTRGESKGGLKAEFKKADEIIEYMQNDKVFMQFMSGEKQTIMTGTISGVPFKIKMDSYSKGIAINDLKVMRSVTDSKGNFVDFISPWGYDLQLAGYQEIVYQNTGVKLPCFICAVTKESPINSVIVQIPQGYLDRALYRLESSINHLYDVKMGKVTPNGCGVCKTCIEQRKTTPIISMDDLFSNN